MIKLGVSGALGKMGTRILEFAAQDPELKPVLALERMTHPEIGTRVAGIEVVSDKDAIGKVDGLIDFSSVEGTLEHLGFCIRYRKPLVIGTTGLSAEAKEEIVSAAKKIPIVFSPNMSVGVNLLFGLIEMASRSLPPEYKVSMTEAHHVHKKDAPSGTAKFIADLISKERGLREISIQSIRQGEIVGDHEIVFESPWDTLRISHSAKTRDIFAIGALRAMKFIVKKRKGLYSMQDVIGDK